MRPSVVSHLIILLGLDKIEHELGCIIDQAELAFVGQVVPQTADSKK